MKGALPLVLLAGAGVLVYLAMQPGSSTSSAPRALTFAEREEAARAAKAQRAARSATERPTGSWIDDGLGIVGGVVGSIFGGPGGGAAGAEIGHAAYDAGDAAYRAVR